MRQSCVAMSRPKPRDEPVTQATCPASGLSESIVLSLAEDRGEHIAPVNQSKRRSARPPAEGGPLKVAILTPVASGSTPSPGTGGRQGTKACGNPFGFSVSPVEEADTCRRLPGLAL